jgi:hypothetical protein
MITPKTKTTMNPAAIEKMSCRDVLNLNNERNRLNWNIWFYFLKKTFP